jgi:hypothetical protein
MSATIATAIGVVEVVADHASHPGYRSIRWRRTDQYREPGMEPMPMWVREADGVRVGDEIKVIVECAAALARVQGAGA